MRDAANLETFLSEFLAMWIRDDRSSAMQWLAGRAVAHLGEGVSQGELVRLRERVRSFEDDLLNAEETREGEEEENRDHVQGLVAEIDMLREAVEHKPLNVWLVFRGQDVAHACATARAANKRAKAIRQDDKVATLMEIPLEWLS